MNGILTVGELKRILVKYSDETQIVVANEEWYLNISEVVDTDEMNFAITLHTSNTFDPSQF